MSASTAVVECSFSVEEAFPHGVNCKAVLGEVIRRFCLPVPSSKGLFASLCATVGGLFGLAGEFAVGYVDEEGDLVSLTSDAELVECLRLLHRTPRVLRFTVTQQRAAGPPAPSSGPAVNDASPLADLPSVSSRYSASAAAGESAAVPTPAYELQAVELQAPAPAPADAPLLSSPEKKMPAAVEPVVGTPVGSVRSVCAPSSASVASASVASSARSAPSADMIKILKDKWTSLRDQWKARKGALKAELKQKKKQKKHAAKGKGENRGCWRAPAANSSGDEDAALLANFEELCAQKSLWKELKGQWKAIKNEHKSEAKRLSKLEKKLGKADSDRGHHHPHGRHHGHGHQHDHHHDHHHGHHHGHDKEHHAHKWNKWDGKKWDRLAAKQSGATFLEEVTVVETASGLVEPGCTIRKIWRLRNDSQEAWPAGRLIYIGGRGSTSLMPRFSRGDTCCSVPACAPNAVVEINLSVTAPDHSGCFIGIWRLCDKDGSKWGPKLWTKVIVPGREGEDNFIPQRPGGIATCRHHLRNCLGALLVKGFTNRELNTRLLHEFNFELDAVVAELTKPSAAAVGDTTSTA
eukprot:gnl/Hemi2/17583_TR5799_c0_g20_i1.p1 gnl/Hemi2/17583_TR5799_c0_g20~~gnl/Hemi2/17583_TR5799_c0_g20_i1.p1  ORF type:complete len:578 (-),score=234.00 gnl/Hemi2/17583_TR5799_c0_g20_i1:87-1820(-)